MKVNLPIEADPKIMRGGPVFRVARVPVQSLFEYLEDNLSLEEFLECIPTVRCEDAIAVLEHSERELLVQESRFFSTRFFSTSASPGQCRLTAATRDIAE